jgi:hypothetical protein
MRAEKNYRNCLTSREVVVKLEDMTSRELSAFMAKVFLYN